MRGFATEEQMFGCLVAESRFGIDRLVRSQQSRLGNDANRALASILSDVQELIDRGRYEQARQHLNRVKDALFAASPITLWGIEDVEANLEVENDCFESIRFAARFEGIRL